MARKEQQARASGRCTGSSPAPLLFATAVTVLLGASTATAAATGLNHHHQAGLDRLLFVAPSSQLPRARGGAKAPRNGGSRSPGSASAVLVQRSRWCDSGLVRERQQRRPGRRLPALRMAASSDEDVSEADWARGGGRHVPSLAG